MRDPPRTYTASGMFMVEALAYSAAAAELAGVGGKRTDEDLEAERCAIEARLVVPLGAGERAQVNGRLRAFREELGRRGWPIERRLAGQGACRSCGAPVVWVRIGKQGSPMPLDPLPRPDGNVVRTGPETVKVLKEDEPTDQPRYRSHFDSCPDAGHWRQRRYRSS
jgi:hypothetical protein